VTLYAGIDVGSATTKVVVVDARLQVVGRGICFSAADLAGAVDGAWSQALAEAGAAHADVVEVTSTGYGRSNVPFATATRTEIDCHARGAWHHFQRAITVVDIGGQDSKVIRIDANGRRIDFAMNRKCAAGTGSFLEEVALRLKVPVEKLTDLAARSTDPNVTIGSYCTVFAQSEILARIRAGVRAEDLARAAMESVARRVFEQMAITPPIVATGGVIAHNPGMQPILARVLGGEVLIPPFPQYVGALGAALVSAMAAGPKT